MERKLYLAAIVVTMVVGITIGVVGQKKNKVGKVCGDPMLSCKARDGFQPNELPFDTGKNAVIAESEYFYAIVLRSTPALSEMDCEKPFPESERLDIQQLFRDHKVFALRCDEPGSNYYTGVKSGAPFLAVYAGKTLAEATKFLKDVQATKKFPGVKVRRMKAAINGT